MYMYIYTCLCVCVYMYGLTDYSSVELLACDLSELRLENPKP